MKPKSNQRLFLGTTDGHLNATERVFRQIQARGPLFRHQLADLTGLSPKKVSACLRHLNERGLIKLAPNRTWQVGVSVPMPPIQKAPSKVDIGIDAEHLAWMEKYKAQGLARRARVTA